MNVVFAGTPVFASIALQALQAAGHTISLVLTQPDRPAGRGLKSTASPVKLAAQASGIPVLQPRSLRLDGKYPEDAAAAQDVLRKAAPDLMVVAAYGLLLPRWTLQAPVHGAFNIHASLLPRWRGAAPIQRAIASGDVQTGITIMQMDEGLDTGDILLARPVAIGPDQNAAQLHDALAQIGAKAIVDAIDLLQDGKLRAQPQPEEGACYAAKLQPSEARLDFRLPVQVLERQVRAFNPVPGATAALPGLAQPVKVWAAQALPAMALTMAHPTSTQASSSALNLPSGSVAQVGVQGIDVVAGDGILRLTQLQKAGGKRQSAATFIQGWRQPPRGAAKRGGRPTSARPFRRARKPPRGAAKRGDI